MPKHHVAYTSRAFHQDASNAMKGDIVRGLVELMTNCDDAYGDDAHGKIRIEVEHRRHHPWWVIVRDRARGMRKAKMEHAIGDIGTRTSGFESGARVRGNLGRGAKDLAAFGPVTFESICGGYYTQMILEPDGSFDDLVEHRVTDEDRQRLGIPRGNGTVVSVLVGENIRCPQHSTLRDKLLEALPTPRHQLRPWRELTLVDLNDATSDGIRYGRPSLTEVASREVTVSGYDGVTASVTIWRAEEQCENPSSDSGRPEGLLVKGRRANRREHPLLIGGKPARALVHR